MAPLKKKNYLEAKTLADLIDMGIIPKTSSQHLALIVYRRLEALRDLNLRGITPDMMGQWVPFISQTTIGPEITDTAQVLEYAKYGTKVRGKGVAKGNDLEGKLGVIKEVKKSGLAVEWNDRVVNDDYSDVRYSGHGLVTPPESLIILLEQPIVKYDLAPFAVVDSKQGHRIIFTKDYKGKMEVSSPSSYSNQTITFTIPRGTTASLQKYVAGDSRLSIKIDGKIQDQGTRQVFDLRVADAYDKVRVSSLGTQAPKDLETEVKHQVVADLFPRTILAYETAMQVITALLMGKDFVLYGPKGSGKSETASDIINLAKLQKYIFTPEDCQAQCNPFSLIDSAFARKVHPCPECAIKYDDDHDFKHTGRFNPPKPDTIQIVVADYSEGHGIEKAEAIDLRREDLTGYKIPDLPRKPGISDRDPEGFSPGLLVRTNNGVLYLAELDKLTQREQANLLEALQGETTKPDDLRYLYPADAMVIGSANDISNLIVPLVDRMNLIFVDHPRDVEQAFQVLRRGLHKEYVDVAEAPIGDTHQMEPINLDWIPIPLTVEKAMARLFLKFEDEYTALGEDTLTVLGTRPEIDVVNSARAMVLFDQLFSGISADKIPHIVRTDYAERGISFAMTTRVQHFSGKKYYEMKEGLDKWISDTMPALVEQEEMRFWCSAYKYAADLDSQHPGTADAMKGELLLYEQDSGKAYENMRLLIKAGDKPAEFARLQSAAPFMAYFIQEQPVPSLITEIQVKEMMDYLLAKRSGVDCKELE